MTTSKYTNTAEFIYFYVTEKEWINFTNSVLTSCFFTLNCSNLNESKKTYKFGVFYARYYVGNGVYHYHITNDTRRLICKSLKDKYGINSQRNYII